jgi:tetratricopeptide (TPR) repeat protein
VLLAISAVATLATWQRFGNGLAWDDAPILSSLQKLAAEHRLSRVLDHSTVSIVMESEVGDSMLDLYRPLCLLTFAAVDGLFGTAPIWQHLLNLLLHLGCTGLVYALAQRRPFELSSGWAAFASAWFALLPALGEAHLWISGRFDLLATTFSLCAVWCWQQSLLRRGRLARGVLALAIGACFLAALLSKEGAALAALSLLLLPGGEPLRARIRAWLPFAAALVVYAAIRNAAIGASLRGDGSDLRLLVLHAGTFFLDGLRTILLPGQAYVRAPLEDYRALGVPVLVALDVVFIIVCGLLLAARKRQPVLCWSLLWFALALAPALPVTTVLWPGFNRYLYLPASMLIPGLSSGLRAALARLPQLSPRMLGVMAAVYLGSCALWLNGSAFDWKDSETVYASIVRTAPERSHGWGWLGMWELDRKEYAKALVCLRRATAIAPDEMRYQGPLAHALLFTGALAEARGLADRASERWPDRPQFRLLAAYARLRDDPDAAIEQIVDCLRIDRTYTECREALQFLLKHDPRTPQLAPKTAQRIEREPDATLRAELGRIAAKPAE